MRPYSQTMAGLKDALNLLCRESVGRTERAGWPVLQAGNAFITVALQPFPGRGARDPYRLGSPGHRPPHLFHPLDQKKPTKGVSFALRCAMRASCLWGCAFYTPHSAGRLSSVNNVGGNYS